MFYLDLFGTARPVGHMLGIFNFHFIDPGRGRSFHTGLSLGRLGFHCSQSGNISSRMLCLSEASFLFSGLTNTMPSIRRAFTLPLLADPHPPSLFCHLFVRSSFSLFLFSPTSPHSGSKKSQLSPVTLANQSESSGLMRLLGVAFPGEKEREEWEREQEEAKRRDHRRIGTVR